MDYLTELEHESIFIVREAYHRFSRLALLWSMGKDSTVLLWICRKAFLGRVPFPVIHVDTSYEFDEIYAYRSRLAAEWGLELVVRRNEAALASGMGRHSADMLTCCNALKTETLKASIRDLRLEAVLVGIRRDEHGIRAKERYFSPRERDSQWNYRGQPPELWDLYASAPEESEHTRIHPLLHMTELDIWQYIARERLAVPEIYLAHVRPVVRRGAQLVAVTSLTQPREREIVEEISVRFRTVGDITCTAPVASRAATLEAIIAETAATTITERGATRLDDQTHEASMELRKREGYF